MLLTLPINPTSRKACVAGLLLLWSICSLGAPAPHNEAMRQSSSPYLRQHADNPVAWLPYSNNSMQKAAENQRLIFLSIGYSTCHWCHVMNRESFQNDEVASVLNTAFTAIKMDREQYPDADQYYNKLLTLSGGTAGWPLNGILLPDGTPVWLGNYAQKDRLLKLLTAFSEHFAVNSTSLTSQADIFRSLIETQRKDSTGKRKKPVQALDLQAFGTELLAQQDPIYGGILADQKFPSPDNIKLLWLYSDKTGNKKYANAAIAHLNGMLQGTLFDPVYGGFFRYSTQRDWRKPHFEKMLFTQSQMLISFSEAYRRTGILEYKVIAQDTLDFILHNFYDASTGGFISAIDSEYSGKDGFRYLMHYATVLQICDGASICEPSSNNRPKTLIQMKQISVESLQQVRSNHRSVVADWQNSGSKDTKQIVEWNALTIRALIAYHKSMEIRPEVTNILQNFIPKVSAILESTNNPHIPRQLGKENSIQGTADDLIQLLLASLDLYQLERSEHLRKQIDDIIERTERAVSREIDDLLPPHHGGSSVGVSERQLNLMNIVRACDHLAIALPSQSVLAQAVDGLQAFFYPLPNEGLTEPKRSTPQLPTGSG